MEDLQFYIEQQMAWSHRTFGSGRRTKGILAHIRKELVEIEERPYSIEEWCDVIILAIDGAWRAGHSPSAIADYLETKQGINFNRQWPAPGPEDQPIEHIRGEE